MICDRCHRPLRDPVSERYRLGPVCRAALGVPALSAVALDEQKRRRAAQRRGRGQREAERHGQLKLPLQLWLPGLADRLSRGGKHGDTTG